MMDMRRNGLVGIIEKDGLQPTSMHFAEWWNGEGFDVCFDDIDNIKLHQTQLHALMVLALATEYVSLEEVQEDVTNLLNESKKRNENIDIIRREVQAVERRNNLKIVENDD